MNIDQKIYNENNIDTVSSNENNIDTVSSIALICENKIEKAKIRKAKKISIREYAARRNRSRMLFNDEHYLTYFGGKERSEIPGMDRNTLFDQSIQTINNILDNDAMTFVFDNPLIRTGYRNSSDLYNLRFICTIANQGDSSIPYTTRFKKTNDEEFTINTYHNPIALVQLVYTVKMKELSEIHTAKLKLDEAVRLMRRTRTENKYLYRRIESIRKKLYIKTLEHILPNSVEAYREYSYRSLYPTSDEKLLMHIISRQCESEYSSQRLSIIEQHKKTAYDFINLMSESELRDIALSVNHKKIKVRRFAEEYAIDLPLRMRFDLILPIRTRILNALMNAYMNILQNKKDFINRLIASIDLSLTDTTFSTSMIGFNTKKVIESLIDIDNISESELQYITKYTGHSRKKINNQNERYRIIKHIAPKTTIPTNLEEND